MKCVGNNKLKLKKVDLNAHRKQKAVDKEQKQKGNMAGRGGGH